MAQPVVLEDWLEAMDAYESAQRFTRRWKNKAGGHMYVHLLEFERNMGTVLAWIQDQLRHEAKMSPTEWWESVGCPAWQKYREGR